MLSSVDPSRRPDRFKTVGDFLRVAPERIVNRLSRRIAEEYSGRQREQLTAWEEQIAMLHQALSTIVASEPSVRSWEVVLEYPLFRLGKRIDVVLVATRLLLVLEFKSGDAGFDAAALRQAEDYALDLRDFHAGSRGLHIAPVLVVGNGPDGECRIGKPSIGPGVWTVSASNRDRLAATIRTLAEAAPSRAAPSPQDWSQYRYQAIPTILEAAAELYAEHNVKEIAHARAELRNLTSTTDAVMETIETSRRDGSLTVCFVTGTPGSGKTLVGLNAVHDPRVRDSSTAAAYLSGTAPLVEVLREALARDRARRQEVPLVDCRRLVKSEIQFLTGYLKEHLGENGAHPPPENVIVFDEAQRAWDAAYGKKLLGTRLSAPASEPELFLNIMARRPDWAVIVALVGGGQEINRGEGGLREWGIALSSWNQRHPERPWSVRVAPDRIARQAQLDTLFESAAPQSRPTVQEDPRLHLSVSARSYDCDVTDWVDSLLDGDIDAARDAASLISGFPVRLTRSLEQMRAWLKETTRGFRRCGLVASSGARRLRADGLGVALRSESRAMAETVNWFLNPRNDFRSSFAMEVTASEYTCQGLEMDKVGVCWGGDFLWSNNSRGWNFFRLAGSRWMRVRKQRDQTYIRNKYRVLLTRARMEVVIWVPPGDPTDPTRDSGARDATADVLRAAGARPL